MKYPMKRILSVLLVFVMSLSLLVGCNSTNNGKGKNNGTNTNNANNATGTDNANNVTGTDNANNVTGTNNANNATGTNNANNATGTNNANNATGTNNANKNNAITGAKPGTYTATAKGYSSDVGVTVIIGKDGSISDIKVDASGETAELGGKAAPAICKEVKNKQSIAVDTVTGATMTSNATLTALAEALSKAGADLGELNK